MSAAVLLVDVVDAITCHQLVRGACEGHAAPVVTARMAVPARVAGTRRTVERAMLDIDGRAEKRAEVHLPPRAGARPHAGETIGEHLPEVICAEATHGVSAEEDAVRVDVEAPLRVLDRRLDHLRDPDAIPARTVRRRRCGRCHDDEGCFLEDWHRPSALAEVLLRRGVGRARVPAMKKDEQRIATGRVNRLRDEVVDASVRSTRRRDERGEAIRRRARRTCRQQHRQQHHLHRQSFHFVIAVSESVDTAYYTIKPCVRCQTRRRFGIIAQ